MSEPLNIMVVNMHLGWGGQPSMALALAKGFAGRGGVTVVGAPEGSELKQRAEAAGIETLPGIEFRRGFHPVSIFRDARIMRDCIDDRGIHLVESNGSQDTWAAGLALRGIRERVKLVRWRHNTFPVANHYFNRMLYRDWISRVVVSAPEVKPLLCSKGLIGEDRVSVLYPAIDASRFDETFDRAATRSELGLGADDLVVVMVGRLAPEKGHDVLFRAAVKVAEKVPAVRFLIVGKGGAAGDIHAMAKSMGLADRVVFTGFRADVPRILSACDVNVLTPTSGESFGIVLAEGFYAGIPCVATDVGGVGAVCRNEETGLLCPAGDSDAVAAALARLLEDGELRGRLARKGREMVDEEFTYDALVERADELFRGVLTEGGGR